VSLTLGRKRELFARLVPRLIDYAHRLGFEVMIDETKRGPIQAEWNAKHCRKCQATKRGHNLADHAFRSIGLADSLHGDGLAVDLILRRGGRPLWSASHYLALGTFWEEAVPSDVDGLTAWGGRFGDPGHFSIKHRGKR